MTGTRARWQASLSRALNVLLLKGAPSRPGKTSGDLATLPPSPQPHAFDDCHAPTFTPEKTELRYHTSSQLGELREGRASAALSWR